jgi:hypothetical protein
MTPYVKTTPLPNHFARLLGFAATTLGTRIVPLLGALALLIGVTSVGTSQSPPSPGELALPALGVSTASESTEVSRVGAAGDMIGFSHSDGSGTQIITVIHTGKSWMAVYHIDKSGTIRLVSSRPIDADFSLQLNATSPLPDEIRQLGRR